MQDDLKQIKGIGPGTERKLVALSITTFAQLAALDGAERERIDTALNLRGGAEWDEWQPQARELAAETSGDSDTGDDGSEHSASGGQGDGAGTSDGSGEALRAASPGPTGNAEPSADAVPCLIVSARRSRRRAGWAFGPKETYIPFDDLSEDERDAIVGDPVLSVSEGVKQPEDRI